MQVTDEMVRVAGDAIEHALFIAPAVDLDEVARAALNAALAAMWQPIETAPRDGSRLLAIYGGQVRIIQYGKTSHVPLYGFCLADQGIEDFDLVLTENLKGWMPLPPAPSQLSKRDDAERDSIQEA